MTYHASLCGVKFYAYAIDKANASIGTEGSPLTLSIRHLSGKILLEFEATSAWTVTSVHEILDSQAVIDCENEAFGADAYIGDHWIGSTEV